MRKFTIWQWILFAFSTIATFKIALMGKEHADTNQIKFLICFVGIMLSLHIDDRSSPDS